MALLINQTFFVGDIQIPNLSNAAELERIIFFISKHEPDCLLKILGYPLYKLIGVESSQRMTDLFNGAEYIDGIGVERKWKGIKRIENDVPISLIAYYVYFKFQESEAVRLSGISNVVGKQSSSTTVSPAHKMAYAWNLYSEEVSNMISFIWLKKNQSGERVYPEFGYDQYIETMRISRKIDSIFSF